MLQLSCNRFAWVLICLQPILASVSLAKAETVYPNCSIVDIQTELRLMAPDSVNYYIFLIGGIVGALWNLLILLTFLKYKKMRKSPGDFFLSSSIYEGTLSL